MNENGNIYENHSLESHHENMSCSNSQKENIVKKNVSEYEELRKEEEKQKYLAFYDNNEYYRPNRNQLEYLDSDELNDIRRLRIYKNYRPFNNKEELLEEIAKHPLQGFIVDTSKGFTNYCMRLLPIYGIKDKTGVFINKETYCVTEYKSALYTLTFADASPFGIRINNKQDSADTKELTRNDTPMIISEDLISLANKSTNNIEEYDAFMRGAKAIYYHMVNKERIPNTSKYKPGNLTLEQAIQHCDNMQQFMENEEVVKEHMLLKGWLEELKELRNKIQTKNDLES